MKNKMLYMFIFVFIFIYFFPVFMKKFSFGDEEKIRTAKKLIRGSLFSYGFILAIDLILSAIKSLIT